MRYAFLLIPFLTACLSTEPTAQRQGALDPIVTSGSRVEVRSTTVAYTGADGSGFTYRGDYYFYDKLLSHRCELINDGVNWTCYPASDLTADGTYPGNPEARFAPGFPFSADAKVFSDASCTNRVAAFYDPTTRASTTNLLIRLNGDQRVYELGREVTSSAYYFTDYRGRCLSNRFPSDFFASYRLFELGPTVSGLPAYTRSDGYEVAP
jgi:hypothetical protein